MSVISFLEYTKNYTSPVNKHITNITDFNKLAILDKVSSLKIANPKITKKEISKQVGISDRSLLRFSNDLGENIYQKRKIKKILDPSNCSECDFIAKNKTGLQSHFRSKHVFQNKTKSDKIRQNQTTLKTTEKPKKKKKESVPEEKLGLGKEDEVKTSPKFRIYNNSNNQEEEFDPNQFIQSLNENKIQ